MRPGDHKSGFTLIEIIAGLCILGVLAAMGFMAAAHIARNYQWAKDNAHLAQKAQVALTRIAAELNFATDVQIQAGGKRIAYDAEYPDGTSAFGNNIGIQGNQTVLRLSMEGNLNQGEILADRVTGFSAARPDTRRVTIELRMTGENQAEQVFSTAVALR